MLRAEAVVESSAFSVVSAHFEVEMADADQESDDRATHASIARTNPATVTQRKVDRGLISCISDFFPAFTDIFSNDGRKEIGFLAIVAWHHSIAKLAARNKVSIPPVLLSTISTLVGLSLIRKVKGKGSTDRIVEYFDPSVEFLGTWMTLWLVPSLVLLPNALQKIKTPDRSMWLKLIITHFVLWCGSTVGSAKLYELIQNNTGKKLAQETVTIPSNIINSSSENNDMSESATSNAIGLPSDVISFPSTISNCDGESSNCLGSEAELVQVPSLFEIGSSSFDTAEKSAGSDADNVSLGNTDTSPSISPSVPASIKTKEEERKQEYFKKQLKLLRFWGAITACFYAAPLQGLIATTAPAIGEN